MVLEGFSDVDGNFPENVSLVCFGSGFSSWNENRQWEFKKCRHFASIVILCKYCRSYSFTRVKSLVCHKHVHSFIRFVYTVCSFEHAQMKTLCFGLTGNLVLSTDFKHKPAPVEGKAFTLFTVANLRVQLSC